MSWTRPYLDSFCHLIFTDPPLVNSRWTSGWDGYWVIRPTPALGRTSHITVISGQYYKVLFLSIILKRHIFVVLLFQFSKIPNELYLTRKCSGCVKVKDAGVVNLYVWRMYLQIWYDQDEFCQLKTCCKRPSVHIMLLQQVNVPR